MPLGNPRHRLLAAERRRVAVRGAHVEAVNAHPADLPSIAIGLRTLGPHVLLEGEARQVLMGLSAKDLPLLGRVGPADTDPALRLCGVEKCQRVAVVRWVLADLTSAEIERG
jgi:hypothetical protein